MTFSGAVQYEKWNYPVLDAERKANWATSVGFTFWPSAAKLAAQVSSMGRME